MYAIPDSSVSAGPQIFTEILKQQQTIYQTISTELLLVGEQPVGLSNTPPNATAVDMAVIGADLIYSTDPAHPPTADPVRGLRLADGATDTIFSPNFSGFRVRRLTDQDTSLYIMYKRPAE